MSSYSEKLEQAIIDNDLFSEDQLYVIEKLVYWLGDLGNKSVKESDDIWDEALETVFHESTGYDYEDDDMYEEDLTEKPYKTKQLYKRYVKAIGDPKNVLGMLHDYGDYSAVSNAVDYGINYQDLVDLCAGYAYGSENMKCAIIDFLEDINFHTETGKLLDDADDFIPQVLDTDSDYVKEFWNECE